MSDQASERFVFWTLCSLEMRNYPSRGRVGRLLVLKRVMVKGCIGSA